MIVNILDFIREKRSQETFSESKQYCFFDVFLLN